MEESRAAAVQELRARFAAGTTRPAEWRAKQLRGVLRMATEMEAEICDALHADVGKPKTEAHVHEVDISGQVVVLVCLEESQEMDETQEVLSLDPVIGAIAAGNAVVLKPSEVAPATSSLLAELLPRYIDSTCIKVVEGGVSETTAPLELKWDKIFYTGNSKVGRIVMASAAKHLTPVVLELGGKCPVVVDSNVNLHVTAKRIAAGKWGCNNGQACIAPDFIITTESFAPKLLEALKKVLEKFYGKDPLLSEDLSRVVTPNHFNRLLDLMDDEMVSDKIVFGGQRDEQKLKIAPTIFLDVPLDSAMMKEEIFGPLLPIITVDKIHESLGLINSMTKPLAAYLFTRDSKLQKQFESTISAGGMLLNDTSVHLTNPHLPFGGVGESGTGSYHGRFTFDAFSHGKAVLHRGFGGEAKARYPPYSSAKLKILKGVLAGKLGAHIQAILGFPRGK
ncbi:hypothetical protein ACQ4PT_028317 [Festuca glaucescens]